jgi:hypothetical protein
VCLLEQHLSHEERVLRVGFLKNLISLNSLKKALTLFWQGHGPLSEVAKKDKSLHHHLRYKSLPSLLNHLLPSLECYSESSPVLRERKSTTETFQNTFQSRFRVYDKPMTLSTR